MSQTEEDGFTKSKKQLTEGEKAIESITERWKWRKGVRKWCTGYVFHREITTVE